MNQLNLENEAHIAADYFDHQIDLQNAKLSNSYKYQSLPHCAIDAIFSIGVRYEGTENVVDRFCRAMGIRRYRDEFNAYPPLDAQLSISTFCDFAAAAGGAEALADSVFGSRQRTSPRGGILKAQATLDFAKVLQNNKIEHLQDARDNMNDERLDHALKNVHGQGSGIAVKYFFMLAGDEDSVKPDRMLIGALEAALGRAVHYKEVQGLVAQACNFLSRKYPDLTPRRLDHEIWKFQRQK